MTITEVSLDKRKKVYAACQNIVEDEYFDGYEAVTLEGYYKYLNQAIEKTKDFSIYPDFENRLYFDLNTKTIKVSNYFSKNEVNPFVHLLFEIDRFYNNEDLAGNETFSIVYIDSKLEKEITPKVSTVGDKIYLEWTRPGDIQNNNVLEFYIKISKNEKVIIASTICKLRMQKVITPEKGISTRQFSVDSNIGNPSVLLTPAQVRLIPEKGIKLEQVAQDNHDLTFIPQFDINSGTIGFLSCNSAFWQPGSTDEPINGQRKWSLVDTKNIRLDEGKWYGIYTLTLPSTSDEYFDIISYNDIKNYKQVYQLSYCFYGWDYAEPNELYYNKETYNFVLENILLSKTTSFTISVELYIFDNGSCSIDLVSEEVGNIKIEKSFQWNESWNTAPLSENYGVVILGNNKLQFRIKSGTGVLPSWIRFYLNNKEIFLNEWFPMSYFKEGINILSSNVYEGHIIAEIMGIRPATSYIKIGNKISDFHNTEILEVKDVNEILSSFTLNEIEYNYGHLDNFILQTNTLTNNDEKQLILYYTVNNEVVGFIASQKYFIHPNFVFEGIEFNEDKVFLIHQPTVDFYFDLQITNMNEYSSNPGNWYCFINDPDSGYQWTKLDSSIFGLGGFTSTSLHLTQENVQVLANYNAMNSLQLRYGIQTSHGMIYSGMIKILEE